VVLRLTNIFWQLFIDKLHSTPILLCILLHHTNCMSSVSCTFQANLSSTLNPTCAKICNFASLGEPKMAERSLDSFATFARGSTWKHLAAVIIQVVCFTEIRFCKWTYWLQSCLITGRKRKEEGKASWLQIRCNTITIRRSQV